MEAEGAKMRAADLRVRLHKSFPSLSLAEKLLIDLVLHWIEARYELKEKKIMDVKTLRDEIAIVVLQGLLADNGSERDPQYVVADAYKFSDEMMKEINKNG